MKRNKTSAVRLLLWILLLSLSLPMTGDVAQAVKQSDIDALKGDASDLASQRKKLQSALAEVKDDRNQALRHRELLDQEIALTEQSIANIEQQIEGYNALLTQSEYELRINEEQEAAQYELFCARTRSIEEKGTASYWSVLFRAEDFADLLSRLSDIQEILHYDQKVLNDLRAVREEIAAKKAAQEQWKAEAEAAMLELETQKRELDEQRQAANDLVLEMQSNADKYASQLQEIEEEEERIQQEIVELTEKLAAEMNWTDTVGGYIWPETASKRITSPMGTRNTGIKGASTNHKGVDIGGVGYNTNILAAKAGVVITSKYSSSYGNYVVISHGKGNTTLYAHLSSRKVKEGDTVTQGQVIGISGSTGISSGPHLHYEITENGVRVNPLDYLPGYVKAW